MKVQKTQWHAPVDRLRGQRGDSRVIVSLHDRAEVNLVIDALQERLGGILRAEMELQKRGETLASGMHEWGNRISKLLDKVRIGWKQAADIPEELLKANEDRRFWVRPGTLSGEPCREYGYRIEGARAAKPWDGDVYTWT